MWVQFTSRHCWEASHGVNVVFKPDGGPFQDGRYPVTRECAEDATKAGKAITIKTPKRPR